MGHTRIAAAYDHSFLPTPALAALVTARMCDGALEVLDSDEGGNIGFTPARMRNGIENIGTSNIERAYE